MYITPTSSSLSSRSSPNVLTMASNKNKTRQQALCAPTAPVCTPSTAIHLREDENMSDGEAEAIRALKAEYAAKRAAQKAASPSTSRSLGSLFNITC